jgi:hypothetical protein
MSRMTYRKALDGWTNCAQRGNILRDIGYDDLTVHYHFGGSPGKSETQYAGGEGHDRALKHWRAL